MKNAPLRSLPGEISESAARLHFVERTSTHEIFVAEDKRSGDAHAMVDVALPADDEHIIELCVSGERPAQRQLYEHYSGRVYRLMYRMVGSAHVDDLTQQVFLCVFHKLDKFQHRSTFSTWLFRVAANEALQFLRRQRSECRTSCLRDIAVETTCATDEFDQRDLWEWALAQLEPDLRAIFLLRVIDELSYFEIAMSLDIAEGTVASRLNRARHCLREIISPALDLV